MNFCQVDFSTAFFVSDCNRRFYLMCHNLTEASWVVLHADFGLKNSVAVFGFGEISGHDLGLLIIFSKRFPWNLLNNKLKTRSSLDYQKIIFLILIISFTINWLKIPFFIKKNFVIMSKDIQVEKLQALRKT